MMLRFSLKSYKEHQIEKNTAEELMEIMEIIKPHFNWFVVNENSMKIQIIRRL
jgi:hypothetical protein